MDCVSAENTGPRTEAQKKFRFVDLISSTISRISFHSVRVYQLNPKCAFINLAAKSKHDTYYLSDTLLEMAALRYCLLFQLHAELVQNKTRLYMYVVIAIRATCLI